MIRDQLGDSYGMIWGMSRGQLGNDKVDRRWTEWEVIGICFGGCLEVVQAWFGDRLVVLCGICSEIVGLI